MPPVSATAVTILDAAERVTQAVGYNGLSFRDLAEAVGIKSASVHYHYPSKGQLGAAIARRYTDRLMAHLNAVDALGLDVNEAMAAYVAVFRGTLERDGRMCLCGMLAAEKDAVPPEVQAEVRRFVDLNVAWIAATGARAADIATADPSIRHQAMAVFAALEGAMLVARGMDDIALFDTIVAQFARTPLLDFATASAGP